MKKNYILILLILPVTLFSQTKRKLFYATLKDEVKAIENAHIINLKNHRGTFSLTNGNFRILANVNDSLRISAVGYKTKYFVVKNDHLGIKETFIKLDKQTIELDEVVIKKHLLEGILERDMRQTPEDIAIVKSKAALDFSNIDFESYVIKSIDEIDRSKPTDMRKVTDPTAKFAGVGGGFSTGLDGYSQKLKKQRKEIIFKENFPKMLLSEFGTDFFFNDLKIPKESYYHFLDYCSLFNIEKLYKENKKFQLIDILTRESKNYRKSVLNNSDEK